MVSMTVRINVTLDETLLKEIKDVSEKGVSRYLAEAAAEKLRRAKAVKTLKVIRGSVPTFSKIDDSVGWVNKLRASDEKRSKRLGV